MTDKAQMVNQLTPPAFTKLINTTFNAKPSEQLDDLKAFINNKNQKNNIISPTPHFSHKVPILGRYLINKNIKKTQKKLITQI